MKKITLLAAAFIAISFASCKKDYTCECTTTYTGTQTGSSTASGTTKATKKDAKESCEAGSTSSSGNGFSSTTTCKIK